MVVKDYLHQSKTVDLSAFAVLTRREREVLQLYAEGKITRQIDKAFTPQHQDGGVSPQTDYREAWISKLCRTH